MPRSRLLIVPFLCLLLLAASPTSGEHDVSWFLLDENGPQPAWTSSLTTATHVDGFPLEIPPWFPQVADVEISMLDGGSFRTTDALGDVLVLDFWATWCAPCREELPHLQRVVTELADSGVRAVAVNAEEPDRLVRDFIEDVGLTLPVGRYNAAAHRAFRVGSLPTLILIDREGRVRYRWDGYRPGLEELIERRVRELAANRVDAPPARVADIVETDGTIGVRWGRRIRRGAPTGVAITHRDGNPELVLSTRGQWIALKPDGSVSWRADNPTKVVGSLVLHDLNGDGTDELVNYRRGGARLAVLDPLTGQFSTFDAPAPILDLAVREDRLVLATLDGVFLADREGAEITPLEPRRETSAVAIDGRGTVWGLSGGKLRHYGESTPLPAWDAPPQAWGLALDAGGLALLPPSGRGAVVGDFSGHGRSIAVAADGRLAVLDLDQGTRRFATRWPEISAVTAGDLDGDGVDELVVASGNLVTVLGRTSGDVNKSQKTKKENSAKTTKGD